MDKHELNNRFAYHPPTTNAVVRAHGEVRGNCADLAQWLNDQLPEGREKALAMTHLEEVMMWANAAIARTQTTGVDGSEG